MLKFFVAAAVALTAFATAQAEISYDSNLDQIQKTKLADEAVIALQTSRYVQAMQDLHLDSNFAKLRARLVGSEFEVLLSTKQRHGYRTLVRWKPSDSSSFRSLVSELEELSYIDWVQPNYLYEGELREFIQPQDPMFSRQIHHPIVQSQNAWMFTQGSSEIIVAVTDDGVDIDHEDLRANIWTNPYEIPGSGNDDDANGFVDDVNGWDFSSDDNDPRPIVSVWGGSHGTHVAGIISAAGDSRGLVGVAPKVKIMPIRFYGSGSWTSSIVAKSFAYAVDNGAHIISTSYNIDFMANDPIFREAIEYVYQNQVLHFNSAGNGSQLNPNRQILDELILVCSTEVKAGMEDVKSDFSNYGDGVDICAPGSDIWSTVPDNRYSAMSGTSMAAPLAAGVAALIWSLNPSWTRDQVAARLFQGAENIDAVNPNYVNVMGAGRVNAFRSLAFRPRPPRINRVELDEILGKPIALRVYSKNIFRPDTVMNMRHWVLQSADGQRFPLEIEKDYKIGTNVIELRIVDTLPPGEYEFRALSGGLRDPFNQALDGNANSLAGGDFRFSFIVEELHAKSEP